MRHLLPLCVLFVIGLAACSSPRSAMTEGESEDEKVTNSETARQAIDIEPTVPLFRGLDVHSHPISTSSPKAQRYFDQGLVLAFAFNHADAARSFRQAQRYDPTCAMCYWGEALVLGPNYNTEMPRQNVSLAWNALQRAKELSGSHITTREQAYIQALDARYGPEPVDDRTRLDQAYVEAMKRLADTYPDDHDASALYAEAMMTRYAWDLWTENGEPKAWTPRIVDVLERVLDQAPQHVLANHLYIRAFESSSTPERALPHAQRLTDMVPGSARLVHVPAHIFIQTGNYRRATEASERAAQVFRSDIGKGGSQGVHPLGYRPHNHHFLWASTALEGRREEALAAARRASALVDPQHMRKSHLSSLQHFQAIPDYAHVTFGRWDLILETPQPDNDLPYTTGAWHYARGMAELRTGDLQTAREHAAQVETLSRDDRVERVSIWDVHSAAEILVIAADVLRGEIAAVEGRYDEAITRLREAAERERALQYGESPPWGPSVRRHLGAVLLEAERPREAERVYRQDLDAYPDNGWSLYGLAKSLEAQGQSLRADEIREQFQKAWRHADIELTSSRF